MKTAAQPYGNPTNPREQAERRAEAERKEALRDLLEQADASHFITEPWGRRFLRAQLAKAGLYTHSNDVLTCFRRHHGEMAAIEQLRTQALQTLWPILRKLAKREIPWDAFETLMLETDA